MKKRMKKIKKKELESNNDKYKSEMEKIKQEYENKIRMIKKILIII